MPAPTALLRRPDDLADALQVPLPQEEPGEILLELSNSITPNTLAARTIAENSDVDMHVDEEGRPKFTPLEAKLDEHISQGRKIPIPPHRMAPLKREAWSRMYPPLVEFLKLQVRMNTKNRAVELRTSKHTVDTGSLQKGEDFIRAFTLGFEVDDAVALLRLDDLYIETFEIRDVKNLQGDHLARAIGRIAGKDGKTKYAIETASRTRIVLADQKIHILGGFRQIHIAREAIVSLILGAPPGKVYGNLRTVAARMKERF